MSNSLTLHNVTSIQISKIHDAAHGVTMEIDIRSEQGNMSIQIFALSAEDVAIRRSAHKFPSMHSALAGDDETDHVGD